MPFDQRATGPQEYSSERRETRNFTQRCRWTRRAAGLASNSSKGLDSSFFVPSSATTHAWLGDIKSFKSPSLTAAENCAIGYPVFTHKLKKRVVAFQEF
jgi:hypothetical protein